METTAAKPFFITRFFRWLFSWRTTRRFLIGFATLITFWALFHAEENWRGKRTWQKYKAGLEAQGEKLDLKDFIPKPVPDEQNFAATPFLKSMFPRGDTNEWSTNYSAASFLVTTTNRHKGERQLMDLVAWQQAFAEVRADGKKEKRRFQTDKLDAASRAQAAPALLEGLHECDTVFAELRAASDRPYSRSPVNYNLEDPVGILLPHLARHKGILQRLLLKACAELAVGHTESALADVKLALCITDAVKEEPLLISYLVRLACQQLALHPIWEGLAEQRWTDGQLLEIQIRLLESDFLGDLKKSLDAERAFGILATDLMARRKYHLSDLFNDGWYAAPENPLATRIENLVGPLIMPRGWFSFELVNICRMYDVPLKETFNVPEKRVFADRIKLNAEKSTSKMSALDAIKAVLQHRIFAKMLLPALEKTPLRAAMAQIATDQAILACALERYRLANGQFPENLEVLVPQFIAKLPHDILTGEPYHYRRTADGRFILYSVGWNGKDDGGTTGKSLFDDKNGDWVWRYPAKQ